MTRRFRAAHRRRSHQLASLSAVGLTVVLLCALSACTSSGSHTPSASPSTATTTSSSATSGTGSGTPLPTADPAPLSTVPTSAVRTLAPVPLRSAAAFGTGITARVTALTHGVDKDQGPGAATGKPTVEFHVRLTNDSSRTISVANVQVSAAYGASSTPAISSASDTSPFIGRLSRGQHADAVYSFAVPESSQGRLELTVTYAAGEPTVLLVGSAS